MATSSRQSPSTPPSGLGEMQKREMWLAYGMLAPTFLMVLAIVLFPLLANFWISFKPVTLGDLRAPVPVANERLRGKAETVGDEVTLQYRLRGSAPKKAIEGVVLEDVLPEGLEITELDERCTLDGRNLRCDLGNFDPGFRGELTLPAVAGQAFVDDPVNPRDSKPVLQGKADNILTSAEFTLDNFRRIFSSPDFWGVLRVSLYYTIFGTAGALLLGLFAAQLLNTVFPGRSILRGLFLFPYVAPVIAVAFTWVILLDPFSGSLNAVMRQVGAIDQPINFFGQRSVPISFLGLTIDFPVALTTVIVFEAWRYFPLSFLFILARMQSIPSDMYEAAEIDGATPLQQFWHISLPQLAGILAVLFLLRFIWTFNKFDDIFLLTGGGAGTRTLTVDVYEQGFAVSNLGAGAAVAVVVFIVLLVFATIFIRYAPKDDG
ncbi:MAG: carbohydrate ABC transporter permease [Geminicoccaceae bacterium]